MARLLIGYDIERAGDPDTTRHFLRQAEKLHTERQAPCTFFMLGMVVEQHSGLFAPLVENPLFDFQQHTYSHVLLKSVCIDNGKTVEVIRGGTLEKIEEEVARTGNLLQERFGVKCKGLTGPWCYYRGLMDRPDILDVLHRQGIRFTRTYGRDSKDWQPVDFAIQPFFYKPQGYPDILEFPVQGWQDCVWRDFHGWDNLEGYRLLLKQAIDTIAENNWTWCYGTHDWSSIRQDPEMSHVAFLIDCARERGVEIETYMDYYEKQISRGGRKNDI